MKPSGDPYLALAILALFAFTIFCAWKDRNMKRFKFDYDGMYIYYFGADIGEAIQSLLDHRGMPKLKGLKSITEEPIQAYERP